MLCFFPALVSLVLNWHAISLKHEDIRDVQASGKKTISVEFALKTAGEGQTSLPGIPLMQL